MMHAFLAQGWARTMSLVGPADFFRLTLWAPGLLLSCLLSVSASAAGDTGQITCHDAATLTGAVTSADPDPEARGFDRQDCTTGAAAAQALGAGFASDIAAGGGDWSKLDGNGDVLPADAASWACVRDNLAGLVWEVKTDDGGLRDRNHTYTWRSTDAASNGGIAGSLGDDDCNGTLPNGQCNTEAYAAAVNAATLCGASNWRLPNIGELEGLVDFDRGSPAINPALFPEAVASFYWSAQTSAADANGAWGVVFDGGRRVSLSKGSPGARVRLVRSAP